MSSKRVKTKDKTPSAPTVWIITSTTEDHGTMIVAALTTQPSETRVRQLVLESLDDPDFDTGEIELFEHPLLEG